MLGRVDLSARLLCPPLLLHAIPHTAAPPLAVCWKDSYARGAGKVIDSCPSAANPSKSGLLCYPPCSAGMVGVGPVW